MKQLTPQEALHRLAAYCSKTERCLRDVKCKLLAWEIPLPEHAAIIRRLEQERLLDEARFCRSFVNDKSKFNQWGTYKISYELRKRNISEDLIKESLEGMDQEEQIERLRRIIQIKKRNTKGKDEFEMKQKLIRFAAGRGFSLDEIGKVLGSLV